MYIYSPRRMVPWGRVIMSMTATDYLPVRLIGLGCLVVTALGWGLNWPATKFLLEQCPPLTARGLAGVVAGLALAGIAAARGENLAVPPRLRLRLVASALLNVSAWMGLTTLSLLWLNAGEAATLAYTMPVWAALLAWPILGEQLGLYRIVALLLGIWALLCCSVEICSTLNRTSCRASQSRSRQPCSLLWALCSPNAGRSSWILLR